MKKLQNFTATAKQFLDTGIWKVTEDHLPKVQRFLVRVTKVILIAVKGFKEDRVKVRASAMTFFSLLSIVPVLAMAFGIAKGFGLDKEFERQIIARFSGQEEVLTQSLQFAQNLLENTKGGLIAGIGFVILMYSTMALLLNIERSFNDIWYIKKERPLVRKLTDYLTIIIVAPLLMILSSSLTIFISNTIKELTQTVELINLFKGLIFPLLRLLPFIVVWLMFTFLYLIMPYTRVKFSSAFVAGIIAGSAFQILQWGFIRFAINLSSYNAIYGSFSVLPLFLIWLQFSWLIVLFGAEISYAYQNVRKHEFEMMKTVFSQNDKKLASLLVMHFLTSKFTNGDGPSSFHEINSKLKIPSRYLKMVLETLQEAGLVSKVVSQNADEVFQPARDPNMLTAAFVLKQIDHLGDSHPIFADLGISEEFENILEKFDQATINSPANMLLKDIKIKGLEAN